MNKLTVPLLAEYRRYKTKRCAFFKLTADKQLNSDLAVMINRRITICDRYKYIYYSFPKCANTTTHIMLAINGGSISRGNFLGLPPESKHELGNRIKRQEVGGFKKPIDLDKKAASLLPNFFSFAITRNPYTRVASSFFDKIQRKKVTDIHAAMRRPTTANIKFDDFVDYLLDGGIHKRDYWTPQTTLLPIKKEKLSYIARFESLDKDLTFISEKIFGAPPFLNDPVTHTTKIARARTPLYTDRTAEAIFKLYSEDFSEFQYDIEPPEGV